MSESTAPEAATTISVQQIIDRSSHCTVTDGAGRAYSAVKAKIDDLRQLERALSAAESRLAEVEGQHMELIMAVAQKWPNETRHQTALRYINEREAPQKGGMGCVAAAPKPDSGKGE